MRNFELEIHFSKWEFKAKYHMTASDMESMSLKDLMAMATPEEKIGFENLWLGYTETWGDDVLRQSIASTYTTMKKEDILCFCGAEEGIYIAMRVLLEHDDHAIVVVPNYQAAETLPLEICEVTGVQLQESNNWRLDIDDVAKAIQPNTKLISINFPNNPTGATMPAEDIIALVALCRKHDIYLFSDEVYRGLENDETKRMVQVADLYEKGFSLNVLSKAYGFPGLRLGWIASQDKEALLRFERYKHYLSICNAGPSEYLAKVVLNHREEILERNRNRLSHNLSELEKFFRDYPDIFDWYTPDGGCIAYPRYKGRGTVEEFCETLVEKHGVLLLPASIYRSELMDTPTDRFRIGFGRRNIEDGLNVFREFLDSTDLT
ncbi:MAG: aspartate/methionine/tyrosine aminotransferase [Desulforhopalus sp.]|jgi:aspartate/methionine/tyrosine aminotransferase